MTFKKKQRKSSEKLHKFHFVKTVIECSDYEFTQTGISVTKNKTSVVSFEMILENLFQILLNYRTHSICYLKCCQK